MRDRAAVRPLVAVVTPVYNGAPYLEAALACVQAQSYPNLVHVVLDNASTDDTADVIARFANGRVPVVTRRNAATLPQVENWNAALAMTPPGARYVKLLCADDLMRSDCIERLVDVAETDDEVTFVTALDVCNEELRPFGVDPSRQVFDGRDCARKLLTGELVLYPYHHVFFRVTPDRIGGRTLDTQERIAGDADLVIRLLLEGKLGFVNAPLFYTRYHEMTLTARMGGSRLFVLSALSRFERYGRMVLSDRKFRHHRRALMRVVLRHILAWEAFGQHGHATAARAVLATTGCEPHGIDYVLCIAGWPAHLTRKTMRRIRSGRRLPRLQNAGPLGF